MSSDLVGELPKAELHVHIEGTLEPDLMLALGERNEVPLRYATVEEALEAYEFADLQSFLNIYYEGTRVLQKEEDFHDLTRAYLKRARHDNVVHAEIFFDPQAHTERGVPFEAVLEGIRSALDDRRSRTRHHIAAHPLLPAPPRPGAGDGDARAGSPLSGCHRRRRARFFRARQSAIALHTRVRPGQAEEGLLTVAHAGEEGPPEYIWEALDLLHVRRIDHGVRCLEDDELVERLRVTASR